MSKYAGQKVRFVGSSYFGLSHGKVYEACERNHGDYWVSVTANNDGDPDGGRAEFFELVEESKFKAGDLLRCLADWRNEFTAGKIYEACEVPDRLIANGKIGIVANDEGRPSWWYEENFELVTDDTPHIVAMKDEDGQVSPITARVHSTRGAAATEARQMAELFPGTEYSIYARVAGYRADKPVAQEVA